MNRCEHVIIRDMKDYNKHIYKEIVRPSYYSCLVAYLLNTVGVKATDELIQRYNIGACKGDGAAALWRLDGDGNPLDGSAVLFDAGTGQVIMAEPITHRLMKPWEWWVTLPAFFGGHLVYNASTIAIVQDEITALFGAVAEPSFTWLAVGYGQNVTRDMLVQLTGHDVILFADSLNAEAWHGLRLPNKRMAVSDAFVCADVNQYLLNKRKR